MNEQSDGKEDFGVDEVHSPDTGLSSSHSSVVGEEIRENDNDFGSDDEMSDGLVAMSAVSVPRASANGPVEVHKQQEKEIRNGGEEGEDEEDARCIIRSYHWLLNCVGFFPVQVVHSIERTSWLYGFLAHSFPYVCIIVGLLVGGILVLGQQRQAEISEFQELWIPQNSREVRDLEYVEDTYGVFGKTSSFIALPRNAGQAGIMSRNCLLDLLALHNAVVKISTSGNSFSTLCKRSSPPNISNPLDMSSCSFDKLWVLWQYNETVFESDSDYLYTLGSGSVQGVVVSKLFGGVEYYNATVPTFASAVKMSYTLRGEDEFDDLVDSWEELFLDYLETTSFASINVLRSASRSASDVLGSQIREDLNLLMFGILAMLIYVSVFLGGFWKGNRTIVAVVGLGSVLLGIYAGLGLAGWLGIFGTPSNGAINFLLLGIGVDDIFVIVNMWDVSFERRSMRRRTASMISRSSTAIIASSGTTFLALASSWFSVLPAIQSFSRNASSAVATVFFSVCTVFVGAFVIDVRIRRHVRCFCLWNIRRRPKYDCEKKAVERKRLRRLDKLHRKIQRAEQASVNEPESRSVSEMEEVDLDEIDVELGPRNVSGAKAKTPVEKVMVDEPFVPAEPLPPLTRLEALNLERKKTFLSGVLFKYGRILLHDYVRLLVLGLFLVSAGVGIWNIGNLKMGLDQSELIPENNYFADYLSAQEEHFSGSGAPLFTYTKTLDYSSAQRAEESLEEFQKLQDRMLSSKWTRPPSQLWVDAFKPTFNASLGDQFFPKLTAFLSDPESAFWRKDIVLDDDANPTKVISSRGWLQTVSADGAMEELEFMNDVQDIAYGAPIESFAFQFPFIVIAQWRLLPKEAVQNLIVVNICVFIASLLLLIHPVLAVLTTLSVMFIDLSLVTGMVAWGIKINSISLMLIVMAVGLAVDYNVHIAHHFVHHAIGTRKERALDSLVVMGKPVINGAITTFLGIAFLGLSSTLIFRTFNKMFILVIGFSLIHALSFLPVMLSLVGPTYVVVDHVHFCRSVYGCGKLVFSGVLPRKGKKAIAEDQDGEQGTMFGGGEEEAVELEERESVSDDSMKDESEGESSVVSSESMSVVSLESSTPASQSTAGTASDSDAESFSSSAISSE